MGRTSTAKSRQTPSYSKRLCCACWCSSATAYHGTLDTANWSATAKAGRAKWLQALAYVFCQAPAPSLVAADWDHLCGGSGAVDTPHETASHAATLTCGLFESTALQRQHTWKGTFPAGSGSPSLLHGSRPPSRRPSAGVGGGQETGKAGTNSATLAVAEAAAAKVLSHSGAVSTKAMRRIPPRRAVSSSGRTRREHLELLGAIDAWRARVVSRGAHCSRHTSSGNGNDYGGGGGGTGVLRGSGRLTAHRRLRAARSSCSSSGRDRHTCDCRSLGRGVPLQRILIGEARGYVSPLG